MNVLRLQMQDPDSPEVRALLEASDAYAASLYPAESNHLLDMQALRRPSCGAIVRSGEDWVEIKRMFVDPAARARADSSRSLRSPITSPIH